MRCPSLSELPAAPPGRIGWPWTEESFRLPETPESAPWPRITIVTPSFNQGPFIEETIRSILLQGYPDLEYFIFDGGSTDNTVEIIRKYSSWISFWVSERDRGQSAAINRGLRMGSGLHATWICSDDMLCRNALTNHLLTEGLAKDVVYIGDCIHIDETGRPLFTHCGRVQSFEDLVHVGSVWCDQGWIDQPGVIFPLELALRDGLNEGNYFSMDYELWGHLLLRGARVHYTGIPFGFFRRRRDQKTNDEEKSIESMIDAAERLVVAAKLLASQKKEEILAELKAYRKAYKEARWKQSGRLAKLGLPPAIIEPLRHFRRRVEEKITNFIPAAFGRGDEER
jgi:glycosyltransferase involved in cell wall biosynthesis